MKRRIQAEMFGIRFSLTGYRGPYGKDAWLYSLIFRAIPEGKEERPVGFAAVVSAEVPTRPGRRWKLEFRLTHAPTSD